MGVENVRCPICYGVHGGECRLTPTTGDYRRFRCDACGAFKISRTVMEDFHDDQGLRASPIQRAYLSYLISNGQRPGNDPMILSDWLRNAMENVALPTPPEQGRMLIEIIGDQISETGQPIEKLDPSVGSKIGAIDRGRVNHVFEELAHRGLVIGKEIPDTFDGPGHFEEVDLTFTGWGEYEARKSGHSPGNFGFLAMQYGDAHLEDFARKVIKPAIAENLPFNLIDLRDVAQAGVIDNLLRQQLRDSAFVLVDLTHDNSGAYWEAGYAEGLGKPVIYLCETAKFEEAKTHFDTNHCTTVLWSADAPEEFASELIATIRRSLGWFQ